MFRFHKKLNLLVAELLAFNKILSWHSGWVVPDHGTFEKYTPFNGTTTHHRAESLHSSDILQIVRA